MEIREEDLQEIVRMISARTDCRGLSLFRIQVACRWPVYCGKIPGRPPIFVKIGRQDEVRKTLALLMSVGACELLPRPVLSEPLDFGEFSILCLEWKQSSVLFAEEMSDEQLKSFCKGCVLLSKSLSQVKVSLSVKESDDPERQYAYLADYAARHRLAGRLLRGLTGLPLAVRAYGDRPLVPVHGDLQPKNYGFVGSQMAAVYDLDEVRLGLACEDAAYAFTERCRRLGGNRHRRLVSLFLALMRMSPWPADEWLVAVNHSRLRIAARRLAKHPDGRIVAIDIWRRDRPLRKLYDIICEEICIPR